MLAAIHTKLHGSFEAVPSWKKLDFLQVHSGSYHPSPVFHGYVQSFRYAWIANGLIMLFSSAEHQDTSKQRHPRATNMITKAPPSKKVSYVVA